MNIYSINKPGVPRGLGSCTPDMGIFRGAGCVVACKAHSSLNLHLHGLVRMQAISEIGPTVFLEWQS